MWDKTLSSRAPAAVILIRLMVGAVFLSEGIQKFLYPSVRGTGRFEKIGLPVPEFLGPFVGSFEVTCGVLVLLGLVTRLAVLPLIVIMCTAIATTKIPTMINEGFWEAAHASRTDWSMLLGSLYLLIVGAGPWSCDRCLGEERPAP